MIKIITYKEIMEKYPEAAEDIKLLQESKNTGLTYFKLMYFSIGIISGFILGIYRG